MNKTIYIAFLVFLLVTGCNNHPSENVNKEVAEFEADSVDVIKEYDNAVFCIPSPQFSNLYFKKKGIYPDRSLTLDLNAVENFTTSNQKALNLGVIAVDLAYLNLYTLSEKNEEYLSAVNYLVNGLGLNTVITKEVFENIRRLVNDQDSLAIFLSKIFENADIFLKDNARQQTAALIVAGGWIESFYLLSKAYEKKPDKELLTFMYQQKFVLENLIRFLSPYYNKSDDVSEIVDDLIEIAYDFDVVDIKYSYKNKAVQTVGQGVIHILNSCKILGNEKTLNNILIEIEELRNKITS